MWTLHIWCLLQSYQPPDWSYMGLLRGGLERLVLMGAYMWASFKFTSSTLDNYSLMRVIHTVRDQHHTQPSPASIMASFAVIDSNLIYSCRFGAIRWIYLNHELWSLNLIEAMNPPPMIISPKLNYSSPSISRESLQGIIPNTFWNPIEWRKPIGIKVEASIKC